MQGYGQRMVNGRMVLEIDELLQMDFQFALAVCLPLRRFIEADTTGVLRERWAVHWSLLAPPELQGILVQLLSGDAEAEAHLVRSARACDNHEQCHRCERAKYATCIWCERTICCLHASEVRRVFYNGEALASFDTHECSPRPCDAHDPEPCPEPACEGLREDLSSIPVPDADSE